LFFLIRTLPIGNRYEKQKKEPEFCPQNTRKMKRLSFC